MGRIVVVNFVSIDGVVQSPLSPDEDRDGGFEHGGWIVPYADGTVDAFLRTATTGAGGMLLGRRSYDILAAAWSGADESEPAVAAMNRMPKFVVTSSPGSLGWSNSHAVVGELAPAVVDVRDRATGDLLVLGSARLVRGLAELDLVDEYRLLVFPVVLGTGKRMFDDQGRAAGFDLADSVVTPSGVVILTYRRTADGMCRGLPSQ
jgi:dihydrofolate reductase